MLRLIVSRLLQMPLILAIVFAITFTLAWWVPGNPLDRAESKRPPVAVQQAMKRQYNLDSPWSFVKGYVSGVVFGSEQHGWPDFGPSLQYRGQRVNDIIADGLPVSVSIGALALVIALGIGTVAGVAGALRPGSVIDLSSLGIALLGISLPNFVTGSLLLIGAFGVQQALGVPRDAWYALPLGGWGEWDWGLINYMLLPSLTLALAPAAYIARLVRLGLADIMSSDFIRTARAKGLSRSASLFKHAMKVAYLPVLSFMGPAAASAMTGSFVVEKVFALPGLGEHFVNAVINKDQFLILGIVLTYATLLVLFNLVVDVAYAWIDPRIDLS